MQSAAFFQTNRSRLRRIFCRFTQVTTILYHQRLNIHHVNSTIATLRWWREFRIQRQACQAVPYRSRATSTRQACGHLSAWALLIQEGVMEPKAEAKSLCGPGVEDLTMAAKGLRHANLPEVRYIWYESYVCMTYR